jgi:hypothetical protein
MGYLWGIHGVSTGYILDPFRNFGIDLESYCKYVENKNFECDKIVNKFCMRAKAPH